VGAAPTISTFANSAGDQGMSLGSEFLKLSQQPGETHGAATLHRILTRKHGNPPFGIGVTEHTAGVVDLDLNYDEAIYLLDGDLTVVAGSERFVMQPGELLWMPRGRKISYEVEQACRYLYVTSPPGPNS